MADIRIPVTVGGVTFKNPFYVASGPTTKTVRQLVRIEEAGWAAASIKLSIDPTPYINRKPRYDLFEDRNALAFTTEKRLTFKEGLALIREAKKKLHDLILFANITYAGDDGVDGWVNMAREFEKAGADIIELNMCCPNMSFNVCLTTAGAECTVKQTGASLGQQEDAVAEIVRAIKKEISIPLFVKLTPEGGRIAQIAKTLYAAGADAVSSTGNRMGIPLLDIEHPEKAIYHLQEEVSMSCHSGAWLKPLAQRDTYEMRKLCGEEVKIAATGGITNWRDAVEMILCGGDLLGICAETLISGYDFLRPMLEGLHGYMQEHGYKNVEDFRGLIVPQMKTAQDVTLYSGYAKITQPKLSGPCKAACPYHVPVQAYVQSVGRGDFRTAYDIITEKGLLQGACAYVCPNPCEDACVRGAYGSPVRIRELKRYVLEKGKKEQWQTELKTADPNSHRVAVVGAGAAGIEAASRLAQAGYKVTIFEKEPEIGGILRAEAAGGQLPSTLLKEMSDSLSALGTEIKTGMKLGRDFTSESLMAQGFEAVFLSFRMAGALALPEDMQGTELVRSADELFEMTDAAKGKRVAIMGDGLFALQAAVIATKAGAEKVFLIGKLNRKQSAVRKLLEKAASEITVLEDMALRAVEQKNGQVCTLHLEGEGGMNSTLSCQAVYAVPAADAPLSDSEAVFRAKSGFAGGANVIAAAAEGARAAVQIDRYVRGEEATLKPVEDVVPAKRQSVLKRTGALPYEEAVSDAPISTDEEAIMEGKRCLGCGCGEGCQLCKTICTDFAPHIAARDELFIEPSECVACGMCFNRCPNGNIEMVNTGEKV
ncbi:MAG: FAD-dependent oxidoreductase [Oscillospiraceae bacterium]|nr:FAD-dependent oxidoreductase [Oscillospiraceae bacterium]